jgi:tripartite-type tricarboxylate transporter receptor subunit TctC
MNPFHHVPAQLCAGAALLAATVAAGAADTYPTRPIRMVVPFAAGGGLDVIARAMANKFNQSMGQTAIVDNRGGGNGTIGVDIVSKAVPDGYTILFTTNAPVVINPHMMKVPYEPLKDLAPVSHVAALPFVLIVHPSVPAKNVSELIALAKTKPGMTYSSSGAGGGAHLSGEMLKSVTRIDIVHIPYKGNGPAIIALVGGEVQFGFASVLTSVPLIRQGRVRALALTSSKRSSSLPDVPTVAETPGLAGFETDLWYGLLAPAKTDPKIVDRLYQEKKRVLAQDDFRNQFERTGVILTGTTPQEFAKMMKTDLAKWAAVIKAAGATID